MTDDLEKKSLSERSLKHLEKNYAYLESRLKDMKDLMKLQQTESENRSEYLNSIINKQNKIIESYEHMINELNKSIDKFLKKSDAK